MPCRTHGQTASPTTVGGEIANVVARLERQRRQHRRGEAAAKINGAVGNYTRPPRGLAGFDWGPPARLRRRLGLTFNRTPSRSSRTTGGRDLFDGDAHQHHPDIDWRATCGATSAWATSNSAPRPARSVRRPCRTRSTRSTSRMPRATSAWQRAARAPQCRSCRFRRWQRDPTDSTVLRNMGVALGLRCSATTFAAARAGWTNWRSTANWPPISTPYRSAGEPIQTVMRRYSLPNLTPGRGLTRAAGDHARGDRGFIGTLTGTLPENPNALTPGSYTGAAAALSPSNSTTEGARTMKFTDKLAPAAERHDSRCCAWAWIRNPQSSPAPGSDPSHLRLPARPSSATGIWCWPSRRSPASPRNRRRSARTPDGTSARWRLKRTGDPPTPSAATSQHRRAVRALEAFERYRPAR